MKIEHKISYYVLSALMSFYGMGIAFSTLAADPERFNWPKPIAYVLSLLISAAFIVVSAFLWRRASK